MSLEKQVIQAVARGWCHPDNSHKVMDVDLAKAIAAEVVKSFSPAPPANNVRAMPDDVDVTEAAMVEAVAQAVFESWAFYPDAPEKPAWYPRGNSTRQDHARTLTRAAIAAMQPALDAAREAGRKDGLEQAAQVCETDRLYWMAGKHGICDVMAAEATAYCRNAILALISAAPAPMEAADAR